MLERNQPAFQIIKDFSVETDWIDFNIAITNPGVCVDDEGEGQICHLFPVHQEEQTAPSHGGRDPQQVADLEQHVGESGLKRLSSTSKSQDYEVGSSVHKRPAAKRGNNYKEKVQERTSGSEMLPWVCRQFCRKNPKKMRKTIKWRKPKMRKMMTGLQYPGGVATLPGIGEVIWPKSIIWLKNIQTLTKYHYYLVEKKHSDFNQRVLLSGWKTFRLGTKSIRGALLYQICSFF